MTLAMSLHDTLAAERKVIRAILEAEDPAFEDTDLFDRAIRLGLGIDSFDSFGHSALFLLITAMHSCGLPVNRKSVVEEAGRTGAPVDVFRCLCSINGRWAVRSLDRFDDCVKLVVGAAKQRSDELPGDGGRSLYSARADS